MFRLSIIIIFILSNTNLYADELIFSYEGDVLPENPSDGWLWSGCEDTCSKSIENGHFVLTWQGGGDFVNHTLLFSDADGEPPQPETLWVEWNFRSDQQLDSHIWLDDGSFTVRYKYMRERTLMFGDAAISFEGSDFVTGLDITQFHTYRFESLDGINFTFAVDGQVYFSASDDLNQDAAFFQMFGNGAADGDAVNEWDFVRYGTISNGEAIVSTDPPSGMLDVNQHPALDRFMVTFDQPGYVYIDDVTVETTGGVIPKVIQTRRLDNGEPDTLQIVLDQPISLDELTVFQLNTGGSPNTVFYLYKTIDGACCSPDGPCVEGGFETCNDSGGIFFARKSCTAPQACCLPDRTCQMLDPLCCEDRAGTLQGESSECTTVVTCCLSGGDNGSENTCQNLDPLCCEEQGGISRSNPLMCEGDFDGDDLDGSCGDKCPNDPNKIAIGFCGCGNSETDSDSDTIPDCIDQCPNEDDRIDDNFNNIPDCIDNFEFIPTLSTWGLVVMVLLLLITYKLIFNYSYPLAKE